MKIEIIKEQPDGLKREIFRFYLMSDFVKAKFYLDHYSLQTKETKRKKNFTIEKSYDRIKVGRFGLEQIEAEQVPLTDEIKKEAKDKLFKEIEITIQK